MKKNKNPKGLTYIPYHEPNNNGRIAIDDQVLKEIKKYCKTRGLKVGRWVEGVAEAAIRNDVLQYIVSTTLNESGSI